MDDEKIYQMITDFKKQFKGYKDGDIEFINNMSSKIVNSTEKDEIITFLLNEIAVNRFNFSDYSFSIIEKINDKELGNQLFNIYQKSLTGKNEKWKKQMMGLFFKLHYKIPKRTIVSYINETLNIEQEHAFYQLVLFVYYGHYNKLAVDYLSNFIVKYPDSIKGPSNKHSINFLFSYLFKNHKTSLFDLVKAILEKNQTIGIALLTTMSNYIESDIAKYLYNKTLLGELKDFIKNQNEKLKL